MVVVWVFHAVSAVCLQFVIVLFPDYTHLLFCYEWRIKSVAILKKRFECVHPVLKKNIIIFGDTDKN